MSRFLNPAKMGLLALIELYTEGAIPNECAMHVLSFLASHLIDSDLTSPSNSSDPASRWRRAEATVGLVISVRHFERLLNKNASDGPAAASMSGLWYRFLAKMWAIDSLHALHAFFERLPALLAKSLAFR